MRIVSVVAGFVAFGLWIQVADRAARGWTSLLLRCSNLLWREPWLVGSTVVVAMERSVECNVCRLAAMGLFATWSSCDPPGTLVSVAS